MNKTPIETTIQNAFLEVLEVIGYEGDKLKYADEMCQVVMKKASFNIINSNSELGQLSQDGLSKQKIKEVLQDNSNSEDLLTEILQVFIMTVVAFADDVAPSLNKQQREVLFDLVRSPETLLTTK